MSLTKKPTKPMTTNPVAVREAIFQNSFASGFVHFFTNRIESLAKSFIGFVTTSATSMVASERAGARASRCDAIASSLHFHLHHSRIRASVRRAIGGDARRRPRVVDSRRYLADIDVSRSSTRGGAREDLFSIFCL